MSYNSPFTGQVIQPTDVSYRGFTISADTTLSWPINGNATDNYAARIMNVTASSAALSLLMPPANQTSVGTDALISNVGTNTFTVKNFLGGTIVSIAAGEVKYIYLTSNPTEAGTWGVIAFGASASNVSASALQGLGVLAISNTLNQSHPTASISTAYSFVANDRSQVKIWNGGAGTATLSASAVLGNNWFTLFKNNGTGTFTISVAGLDTIDGEISKTFQPNDSAFIVCTGSGFVTIGYGVSNLFAFTALVKPVTTGTYTLTPSEASNTIQEFIGSLTGNVSVVYPPAVNFYVISNQTTPNGYTLTLTTGVPGSAQAIVASGQQATIICNGNDFLNANTVQAGASLFSLGNGTVNAPSLNFASETNTGIYRPGAGELAVSILGVQVFETNASGINVTGSGTFVNGVSGGTFT